MSVYVLEKCPLCRESKKTEDPQGSTLGVRLRELFFSPGYPSRESWLDSVILFFQLLLNT